MTHGKVKIAVIIAAYNAEMYIERCINSIQNQTYDNWKVYVVNDGSIDNTEKILCRISAYDSRVEFITTKNAGVFKARKRALTMVEECEYITFLDSDDYFCDNELFEKIVCRLDIEKENSIVLSFNYVKNNKVGFKVKNETEIVSKSEMIKHMMIRDIVDGNMCYTIYSAALVQNNFEVQDYNNDDYLNKYNFLINSDKLIYVPWNGYYYYTNPDSQTQRDIRERDFVYYEHVCSFCENILSKYPELQTEADYFRCWVLLWLASNLNKKRKFREYVIYEKVMKTIDDESSVYIKNRYFSACEIVTWMLVRTRLYHFVYTMLRRK